MRSRRRCLALLIVSGCGRIAFDPLADDVTGDGGADAAAPACENFSAWSTPVLVPGLDTSGEEAGSQIGPDGLALYFSRGYYLHVARRADRTSPWISELITDLQVPDRQFDPTVTGDELEMFFTREAPDASHCIYYTSRTTKTTPWSTPVIQSQLCTPRDAGGAYVTADGLALYYTPIYPGSEGAIYVTTRAARTDSFAAGVAIDGLPGATIGSFGYGALSGDQLQLYFEMDNPLEIYEATRTSVTAPFSAPTPVPNVNVATARDEDASITADGLELYFDSDRAGAQGQAIHVATRTCL